MDCLDVIKKVEQNESILHLFLIYPRTNRLITSARSLPFIRCVSKVDGPLWSGWVTKWQVQAWTNTCVIFVWVLDKLTCVCVATGFHFLQNSNFVIDPPMVTQGKRNYFYQGKLDFFFLNVSHQMTKKWLYDGTIFLSIANSSCNTNAPILFFHVSFLCVHAYSQSSTAHSSNVPHSSMI